MYAATGMKRLLLLCAALLLAQLALAGHGIEHAFEDHEAACVECLALPGLQAVPSRAADLPRRLPAVLAPAVAVLPAPTFYRPRAFLSRGPPERQS